METFNELQNLWGQQPSAGKLPLPSEIIKKAETGKRKVKAAHQFTMGLLLITVIGIVVYFVAVSGYKIQRFSIGILLMALALLLRVMAEFVSLKKFSKINIANTLEQYRQEVAQFYSWRKKLHYTITPSTFLLYVLGFLQLLPTFKLYLSPGMYLYVIISGSLLLVGFPLMFYKGIKKELTILSFLRGIQ